MRDFGAEVDGLIEDGFLVGVEEGLKVGL